MQINSDDADHPAVPESQLLTPDQPAVLFADGSADPAALTGDWPAEWTGPRLGRLAQVLGWAGLTGDLALLVAHRGHLIPDGLRDALRPAALKRAVAEQLANDAAQLATRMRPLALFGADAGVTDPASVLDAAFATHPWAAEVRGWLACLWLARLGRHAEAVAAFRRVPDTCPPDDQTVAAYTEALVQTGAQTEADAYLAQFADRFDLSTLTVQNAADCARALLAAGRDAQARQILVALQADEFGTPPRPVPATVHSLVTRLLFDADTVQGRHADALAHVDRELQRQPESRPLMLMRLNALYRLSGTEACLQAALPLLARDPGSVALLSTLALMPMPMAAKAQIVGALPVVRPDATLPPDLTRVLLRLALEAGREAEAQGLAARVQDSDTLARLVLRGDLAPSDRLRDRDMQRDGFHVARGAPDAPVVLVFLGGSGHLAYGLPLARLDGILADCGATAVYAVDSSSRLFLQGLPGVADDFAGLVMRLGRMPVLRRASRVVTLGVAGGGYPALAFGLALNCAASLVYGAKTVIGRPLPDLPDPAVERYLPLTRTSPALLSDLRLHWAPDRPYKAHLHFGATVRLDRAHAERLQDRPGVRLHANPDVTDHDSFLPAIESGQFQRLLARLLATPDPDPVSARRRLARLLADQPSASPARSRPKIPW